MASHRKRTATLRSLSKRQWIKITATACSLALLVTAGIISGNFYASRSTSTHQVSAYSATDTNVSKVSRGYIRSDLRGANAKTSYITVKINGQSRIVLGESFTDVKSVLDAGNITLEPNDVVSPSLATPVNESTVITVERAGNALQTSDQSIAFNVIKKQTSALPAGTEQVQTEGQSGIMETTSLVTRTGGQVMSSNVFTSYVKKAPVDKVILVGTGSNSAPSTPAANIGTTVPVGTMQQWAHDYMLSNGYTEEDFTATVYIISHESGWRVDAANPSGAYGLPQALPGSKMSSSGADWATNYQTQLRWFWGYCAGRYGSVQGAYSHWLSNHNY